jgi:hypothetical protein
MPSSRSLAVERERQRHGDDRQHQAPEYDEAAVETAANDPFLLRSPNVA